MQTIIQPRRTASITLPDEIWHNMKIEASILGLRGVGMLVEKLYNEYLQKKTEQSNAIDKVINS